MRPLKFLSITIGLGAMTFFLGQLGADLGWYEKPGLLLEIVIINVIATFLIYRFLFKVSDPQAFVNAYLLSIFMKLLFYSGLLLALRILMPISLVPNAVLVLICYVLFTILEVTVLFIKVDKKAH